MASAPRIYRVGDYNVNTTTGTIGRGSFATVYLSYHAVTGLQAALKAINKVRLTKKLQQNLESEISIMKKFEHPNIVRLFGIKTTEKHMYLFMEYCAGGDLHRYIRKSGVLSEATGKFFLQQLAAGLKFLHSEHCIHRDLKPQNLLLMEESDSAQLKIADFGFARFLNQDAMATTLCGSPLYMAPEVLRGSEYDYKADLWSVGTILYEMVAGRPPYRASNHIELLRSIDASPPDFSGIAGSPDCIGLLRDLLQKDPAQRLDSEAFFSHPFLRPDPSLASRSRTIASPSLSSSGRIPPPVATPAVPPRPGASPRGLLISDPQSSDANNPSNVTATPAPIPLPSSIPVAAPSERHPERAGIPLPAPVPIPVPPWAEEGPAGASPPLERHSPTVRVGSAPRTNSFSGGIPLNKPVPVAVPAAMRIVGPVEEVDDLPRDDVYGTAAAPALPVLGEDLEQPDPHPRVPTHRDVHGGRCKVGQQPCKGVVYEASAGAAYFWHCCGSQERHPVHHEGDEFATGATTGLTPPRVSAVPLGIPIARSPPSAPGAEDPSSPITTLSVRRSTPPKPAEGFKKLVESVALRDSLHAYPTPRTNPFKSTSEDPLARSLERTTLQLHDSSSGSAVVVRSTGSLDREYVIVDKGFVEVNSVADDAAAGAPRPATSARAPALPLSASDRSISEWAALPTDSSLFSISPTGIQWVPNWISKLAGTRQATPSAEAQLLEQIDRIDRRAREVDALAQAHEMEDQLPAALTLRLRGLSLYHAALMHAKSRLREVRLSATINQAIQTLREEYNDCLDKAEECRRRAGGDVVLLSPEGLIYEHATKVGREAGVDELLGHYASADTKYQRALLLLEVLAMDKNLDRADRQIIEEYMSNVVARISELRLKQSPPK